MSATCSRGEPQRVPGDSRNVFPWMPSTCSRKCPQRVPGVSSEFQGALAACFWKSCNVFLRVLVACARGQYIYEGYCNEFPGILSLCYEGPLQRLWKFFISPPPFSRKHAARTYRSTLNAVFSSSTTINRADLSYV